MINKYHTLKSRWLVLAICFLLLFSCDSDDNSIEITTIKEIDLAQLDSELNNYISKSNYNFEIIGFEDQTNFDRIQIDDPNIELISDIDCNSQAPNSCKSIGSVEHLKIIENAQLSFSDETKLLGFYISFNKEQVDLLQDLEPQRGEGIVFLLPEFRVIITGFDQNGNEIHKIRAIPASANFVGTRVEENWYWINTSLLGKIHSLEIKIESPIDGIETILIDNLVISNDFQEPDNFFTIALIPDTQKYAEKSELEEIFFSQTQYLADNVQEEKIVFISQLGDIVEHGEKESEWIIADKAFSVLDNKVPYAVVVGNHDYEDEWNNPHFGSPLFEKYFPASRYSSNDWWVGQSPDKLSSCQIFDTELGKFMYFHLSVDSPPPTVEWAQDLIDNNPKVPTLITTHAYLRENGRIPVAYLSSTGEVPWNGISADELFDSLVANNDQVFMVTCGHISAEHYQISNKNNGTIVYELLQDYQNRVNGGEGFLRFLRFYPDVSKIQAITYSTWLNTYEMDEDSYFQLNFNF